MEKHSRMMIQERLSWRRQCAAQSGSELFKDLDWECRKGLATSAGFAAGIAIRIEFHPVFRPQPRTLEWESHRTCSQGQPSAPLLI